MPLLAALALATFAQAVATGPRHGARLAWARGLGADSCVGAVGLEEDVKARLGFDPFSLPPDIAVEGVATRTADGFRADLSFRDASGASLGRRKLESHARDCATLGEAVAVAISVAIDPDVSGAVLPHVDDLPVEPPPPPPPPPRAAPRAAVRVTLEGGLTAGVVPGPSDVTSLRASFPVREIVEAGVGVSHFREQREGGFGFAVTTGEVRACAIPWGARAAVRLCGAVLVGIFEANLRSADLAPVDVGPSAWAGAELGPALSLALAGPLRLEAGASALVPIVRRQGFVRGRSDPVWEQAAVGGRAEMGLGLLF